MAHSLGREGFPLSAEQGLDVSTCFLNNGSLFNLPALKTTTEKRSIKSAILQVYMVREWIVRWGWEVGKFEFRV